MGGTGLNRRRLRLLGHAAVTGPARKMLRRSRLFRTAPFLCWFVCCALSRRFCEPAFAISADRATGYDAPRALEVGLELGQYVLEKPRLADAQDLSGFLYAEAALVERDLIV